MSADIDRRVRALTETQALQACDALTIILGQHLKTAKCLSADKAAILHDNAALMAAAGPEEKRLSDALVSGAADAEVVGTAKSMLLLAADLGFEEQVENALTEGEIHQRDLGMLSIPLILGGLAVVLAWVPLEERTTLTRERSQGPDGTWSEKEITEAYKRRVGSEAVKAFAGWLGAFVPKA
jgi:hypothetical protein